MYEGFGYKSKAAFSRFKKGKARLNKRYKIISKSLAISDKPTSQSKKRKKERDGKVLRFKTIKELLSTLKWSKPTYYKFLKGKSRYNKIYTLISDNQEDKPKN